VIGTVVAAAVVVGGLVVGVSVVTVGVVVAASDVVEVPSALVPEVGVGADVLDPDKASPCVVAAVVFELVAGASVGDGCCSVGDEGASNVGEICSVGPFEAVSASVEVDVDVDVVETTPVISLEDCSVAAASTTGPVTGGVVGSTP